MAAKPAASLGRNSLICMTVPKQIERSYPTCCAALLNCDHRRDGYACTAAGSEAPDIRGEPQLNKSQHHYKIETCLEQHAIAATTILWPRRRQCCLLSDNVSVFLDLSALDF